MIIIFEQRPDGNYVAWFKGKPLDFQIGKTRNEAICNLIFVNGGNQIRVVHVSQDN